MQSISHLSVRVITNLNKFKGIEVFKPLETVDTFPVSEIN